MIDKRTIGIPQGRGTIPDLQNLLIDVGSSTKEWRHYSNITEAMVDISTVSQSLYQRLAQLDHALLSD